MERDKPQPGKLAAEAGRFFPLTICKSAAGYYIGTQKEDGMPYTRESIEYWKKEKQADAALRNGEWTQKPNL